MIFSDESKFNLFGSDGKQYAWRVTNTELQREHIQPTVKFGGGNVMVWGCFSGKGMVNLIFIEGSVDSKKYIKILSENLPASSRSMNLNEYLFQQDNAPAHVSKLTKQYFNANSIKIMDWPAQSPDLNPIENIWAYVKHHLSKKNPKNLAELKAYIIEIWRSIPQDFIDKLISSMHKRCLSVIEADGGHTPY